MSACTQESPDFSVTAPLRVAGFGLPLGTFLPQSIMSKMSELDAQLRELFCPDQLFPPRPEDYDAALALVCAIRRVKEPKVLPEQKTML